MKNVNKILFLRLDNKIGDSIVESFFIRELKKLFPQSKLFLMTTADKNLFINNPHIDKLICTRYGAEGWFQTFKQVPYLREQHFDLMITGGKTLKRRLLYALINAKKTILTDTYSCNAHVTEKFVNILKALGATSVNTEYEIFIPSDKIKKVETFIKDNKLKDDSFIVFNPAGSIPDKTLCIDKIKSILISLKSKYTIVLLDYKNKYKDLNSLCVRFTSADIAEVSELIKHSCFVITPDTGIAHIADAFNKGMLVLFSLQRFKTEQEKDLNVTLWRPRTKKASILITEKDVNQISNEDIIQNIFKGINDAK